MKLTSIITVNFNQPEVTLAFLKSIKENSPTDHIEVILVDNGSIEDHEIVFKEVLRDLIYIRSAENLGFAGGNNLGIKYAKGDFLLFLNNDTEITQNLIGVLSNELENNNDIGLISPLLLYFQSPEIIQYAGFTEMNYITCRNAGIGSFEINKGQYNEISRQTAYCHGAAMMCRKADLEQVGLMDENYFLYYEEMDWCEKFKKAGKKNWFIGSTYVLHKESISVGKESKIKTYFMTRNRMLFIRKNTNIITILLFSCYYLAIACPKQILIYLKNGRKDLIKWVLKGVLWNIMHSKNSNNLGFKI
jgi:GT2 family glycosyltransferase